MWPVWLVHPPLMVPLWKPLWLIPSLHVLVISQLFRSDASALSFGRRAVVEEEQRMMEPLSDQRTEGVSGVGASLLSECVILGSSDLPALRSEGDVIIGGLFPVHYLVSNSQNSYHSKPQNLPCNG